MRKWEFRCETLLVIDITTGQNGLEQAKIFNEITNLSGIILTKYDGTAKGGIIFDHRWDKKNYKIHDWVKRINDLKNLMWEIICKKYLIDRGEVKMPRNLMVVVKEHVKGTNKVVVLHRV